MVEKSRREVAEEIAKSLAARDRAMRAKYNLLRVSQRRWRVVRVSSVAEVLHQVNDVITFECVSEPLKFGDALRQLIERRAKGGGL